MSAVNDRVEQIRARLESSGVTFQYQPATMRHDIVFLLAERDELLRRVEQAEVRTQKREQKAYETGQRDGAAAERHGRTEEVEQAERAGAVRALLSAGRAVAEDMNLVSYETGLTVEKFMERRAGAIENGADL